MFKFNLLFLALIFFFSCKDENNLPSKTVVDHKNPDSVLSMDDSLVVVYQDKKNTFWFGSNGSGVYKYANNTLSNFTTKDGLSDNQIWKIEEDNIGNIYFTTRFGITKYNGQSFSKLKITSNANAVWKLNTNDLWFKGAQDSGVVYRYDGTTLYRLTFPKTKDGENHILNFPRNKFPAMKYSPYDVYCIYKDRNGNIWFGTNIGVCRYNGQSFSWINEKELGIDDIAYHVRSIYEDKNGDFWFTNTMHRFTITDVVENGKSQMCYNKEKGIVNSKEHDVAYFMSSVEDNNGNLWMATYGAGVWLYSNNSLTQFPIVNEKEKVTLFSIFKDNTGKLWLGTHTNGAYKLNALTSGSCYRGYSFKKFIP